MNACISTITSMTTLIKTEITKYIQRVALFCLLYLTELILGITVAAVTPSLQPKRNTLINHLMVVIIVVTLVIKGNFRLASSQPF